MVIIKQRERVRKKSYAHVFERDDRSGYSFDCNEDGSVLPMCSEAFDNYADCISGKHADLVYKGVVDYSYTVTEPAVGKCACGAEVELTDQYYGACECPSCKRWHNLFGQELNPPDMWEEPLDNE